MGKGTKDLKNKSQYNTDKWLTENEDMFYLSSKQKMQIIMIKYYLCLSNWQRF